MAKQVGKAKRISEFAVKSLVGGMNIATDPMDLKETEAKVIENMEFDAEGSELKTRRGVGKPLFTFSSDISYIWYDYELNLYLVFLKDKSVYRYEPNKQPILLGKLNGDTTSQPCVCRFGTKILIASNKTLQIYEYSGSTLQTSEKYPVCDYVTERFSRVLVSQSSTNNIKYSAIGDPTNWEQDSNDASSAKDLDVGDISGIKGIYPLSTDLVVFKDNGNVYRVANEPEDWNVTLVGQNSDFINNDAMTNLGKDVCYLSRTGLRLVSATEIYGNYTNAEIGEKCNPAIAKMNYAPWVTKLDRTDQLLINPNSGSVVWVYHYRLGAFTKWIFPSNVNSVAEGKEMVLLGMDNKLYSLSTENDNDEGKVIHQKIVSKEKKDIFILTLYRSVLELTADKAGSAKLTCNGVSWNWDWTAEKQKEEFKTQIRDDTIVLTFETDSVITWRYWDAILVQSYVAMTSVPSGGSGGKGWGSGKKKKWGQGNFVGPSSSGGGSPYG
jgi:hypothetical protein